ncbi:hypothetical protein EDB19DRAFT_2009845 [Suillus lakei]|nr:hypothetical protein EDB19DRAFT_2009845 [Suillus lakei]
MEDAAQMGDSSIPGLPQDELQDQPHPELQPQGPPPPPPQLQFQGPPHAEFQGFPPPNVQFQGPPPPHPQFQGPPPPHAGFQGFLPPNLQFQGPPPPGLQFRGPPPPRLTVPRPATTPSSVSGSAAAPPSSGPLPPHPQPKRFGPYPPEMYNHLDLPEPILPGPAGEIYRHMSRYFVPPVLTYVPPSAISGPSHGYLAPPQLHGGYPQGPDAMDSVPSACLPVQAPVGAAEGSSAQPTTNLVSGTDVAQHGQPSDMQGIVGPTDVPPSAIAGPSYGLIIAPPQPNGWYAQDSEATGSVPSDCPPVQESVGAAEGSSAQSMTNQEFIADGQPSDMQHMMGPTDLPPPAIAGPLHGLVIAAPRPIAAHQPIGWCVQGSEATSSAPSSCPLVQVPAGAAEGNSAQSMTNQVFSAGMAQYGQPHGMQGMTGPTGVPPHAISGPSFGYLAPPHPHDGYFQPPKATASASSHYPLVQARIGAAAGSSVRSTTDQSYCFADYDPNFGRVEQDGVIKYKCLHPKCVNKPVILVKNSVRGHIRRHQN